MPASPLPKLLVILGPTASGKTALALRFAKAFGGEIVNADSRQVYVGMDIATAKSIDPSVPHHCFDLVAPDASFSLAEYQAAAKRAISDIQARGKLPILVGGTGLYIRSLLENLEIPPVPPNPVLRAALLALPLSELLSELDAIDPETGKVIQRSNPRRIIRAIEVVRATGKSFTELGKHGPRLYDACVIGLAPTREDLAARIRTRVDALFASGLLLEAERLFAAYDPKLPSMSGLGYPETGEYLQGKVSLEAAKELLVQNTVRYARRQMTFFKKIEGVAWVTDAETAEGIARGWLSATEAL